MTGWTEVARYRVVDLSDPAKAGFVEPGFYWFVPLAGDQAQPGIPDNHLLSIVGPYGTREEARDAAVEWMRGVLTPPHHDTSIKEAA